MAVKQLILDIIARDKTKQGLTSATRNVGGMGKAVRGIGTGIAAIGLAAFAKESVATFQTVTKETLALNRATGGTVEATSRLRFAATQSGQDIGNFTKAMGLLDKGLVKAAQTGKGPTADAMKQLGVGFTDATGKVKPLTETLPLMAEQFKGMENGPTKTALALQLFGKQGAALLPFLNKGASGIEELMGKTDEFNQVVGTEQVEAYKKNLEAQKKFDTAMTGIKMTLGESLLPAITPVIEKIGDLAKAFGNLPEAAQTGVAGLAIGALALSAFSGPLGAMKGGLTGLTGLLTGAGGAASGAAGGIGAGGASVAILGGALATAAGAGAGWKISEELGGISSAAAAVAIPGGALGILLEKLNGNSRELAEGMRAVGQSLGDMAASNNIDGITEKWSLMAAEMSPEELNTFAASVPGFNQALNSAGLRIDAVSGKITALPPAQLDAVIAPLQAKLDAAKSLLNGLKQSKKPDVDAINKAEAVFRQAQSQMDGIKQRSKPNVDANVSQAHGKLVGIGAELNALPDKTVTVTTMWKNIGKGAAGVGQSATGGEASGMSIVGERGPELVYLPAGSHVATASQTRGLLGVEHYATGTGRRLTKAQKKAQKAAKEKAAAEARKAADEARATVVADATTARDSSIAATKDSTRSFFGLGSYDVGGHAAARDELASAQSELNRSAAGTSARSEAVTRVSVAREKLAATPASAGDWVRGRLDKVRRWKTALGKLAGVWAGNPYGQQLLHDVIEKGPDGGTELAEQLLAAPGELSSLMGAYAQGDSLGASLANYNPDVINANATIGGASRRSVEQLQTVVIQVDGQVLHKSLLKVKRSTGGKGLGLG